MSATAVWAWRKTYMYIKCLTVQRRGTHLFCVCFCVCMVGEIWRTHLSAMVDDAITLSCIQGLGPPLHICIVTVSFLDQNLMQSFITAYLNRSWKKRQIGHRQHFVIEFVTKLGPMWNMLAYTLRPASSPHITSIVLLEFCTYRCLNGAASALLISACQRILYRT